MRLLSRFLNNSGSLFRPSGQGTGLPIQGPHIQAESFILVRLMKSIPGIPGDLVVESNLSPDGGFSVVGLVNPNFEKMP